MKVILANGDKIDLPKELNLEQRKKLVNEIIDTHPEDFSYGESRTMFSNRYGSRQDNNHLIKIRLEVLGTYLIRAESDYTEDVMSNYKKQARPQQERPFSQFNPNVADMNGWH